MACSAIEQVLVSAGQEITWSYNRVDFLLYYSLVNSPGYNPVLEFQIQKFRYLKQTTQ